jgi:Predicted nucleotide-binding protein containing TIR-like domain
MLRVSSPIVAAQLARSIEQGQALLLRASLIIDFSDDQSWKAARRQWIERTDETLDRIYEGPQEVGEFESAAYAEAVGEPWQVEYNDASSLRTAVAVLVSLQDRLDDYASGDLADAAPAPDLGPESERDSGAGPGVSHLQNQDYAPSQGQSVGTELEPVSAAGAPQVFLVHGRDEKLKEAVAGLLEHAGPHPVTILNERPSDRRMLVEHRQEPAAAGSRHAVILLTADDIAGPRLDSDREPHFSPRARQGVVFEMGVLVAALTPRCLCVLYEEGVEWPCDIDGVTYVRLDLAGTWQSKLLLHLRGAGFDYDLNRLASV